MNFIIRLNRGQFYFLSHSFEIWHNISTISQKLGLLGQKHRKMGVNTSKVCFSGTFMWPVKKFIHEMVLKTCICIYV